MCGLGGLPGATDIPDIHTGCRTQHLSTTEKVVNKKCQRKAVKAHCQSLPRQDFVKLQCQHQKGEWEKLGIKECLFWY